MVGLRSRRDTSSKNTRQSLFALPKRQAQKKSSISVQSILFGALLVLSIILYLQFSVVSGNQNKSDKSLFEKSLFTDSSKQIVQKDRHGRVRHRPITAVKKDDLKGLVDDLPPDTVDITYEEAIEGREEIIALLKDAGVKDLDVATVLKLPKWSSVTKLYGEGPVVIGLDRCEQFRNTAALDDASVGTAGLFNTGTNPFGMYIETNCIMPNNTHDSHGGMRWQVPWGKHTLASRKWSNTAGHDGKVNKTNVLPVVLVRDPYSWMQSMVSL